ncbi:DUF4350 domain-containing protein [Sedimenticola sp.]|uniref:DUF4350 domain-containing protein n=1 Tax=Sedimenticola sp. TaxID=1940285 RepID=UPI003D13820A
MSNKWFWALISVLLLLLAGWGVQWFLTNYEQRSREIVTGMSPEAKRNPLLAAERFLNRIHVTTESLSGRDRLMTPPSESGLLLVYRLGVSLPPEREQALMDWVRQGGHLLITPQEVWDDEAQSSGNNLLDALGVHLVLRDAEDEGADETADTDQPDQAPQSAVQFDTPNSGQRIGVAFSDRRVLFDSQGRADWAVETEAGAHLLQFQLGQGRITVTSDLEIFANGAIGERDHALLLALLVGDQRKAWLLYSSAMPALPVLLWRLAPGLVLSLLALGLLWVWSLTRRSGPLLTSGQPLRRNLLEHLAAVGRFVWRTDQASGTFRQSQAALLLAWRKRHPILNTLEQAACCQWIAQHAGLTPQAVERALFGDYQGEQAFIQVTAAQQKLAAQLRIQKGQDLGER